MSLQAADGRNTQGILELILPTSALLLGTALAIKANPGNVFGWAFINPNTVPIYVKFFNVAAANVTPGTTLPTHRIMIPANDATNDGQLIYGPTHFRLWNFPSAISWLATSVRLDTGAQTAPGSGILAEVYYT